MARLIALETTRSVSRGIRFNELTLEKGKNTAYTSDKPNGHGHLLLSAMRLKRIDCSCVKHGLLGYYDRSG